LKSNNNVASTNRTLHIVDSVDLVDSNNWNFILPSQNIYLSIPYLKAIEDGLTKAEFRYVVFLDNNSDLIGIAYFQLLWITKNEINSHALVNKFGRAFPKSIIEQLKSRILICGNAFATGENGFYFSSTIGTSEKIQLLNQAFERVVKAEKQKQKPISIALIKEFWSTSNIYNTFSKVSFHELMIDVNMVVDLDSRWRTFDDYLFSLNSKFRTKAKQVFNKSDKLEIVDFDCESILERINDINELYHGMVDKANFSFGRLNANTFLLLKKTLKDSFYFKAYLLNNQLIGFATATHFDNILDGNFIGINHRFVKDYALYQRILYDFIDFGIKCKSKVIRLGRTAEEIKSGVGALPKNMTFYAKHQSKFFNLILTPFLKKVKPSEYNIRQPFKKKN